MGGSPVYLVERKLGKGGFGQVYVGRRSQATTAKDGMHANQVRANRVCPFVVARVFLAEVAQVLASSDLITAIGATAGGFEVRAQE